ncbi:MAG: hypothetical protein AB1817_04935 [Chloroflexota bacterium]
MVSLDNRVVLAHPIPTYLTSDNSTEKSAPAQARLSTATRPPISANRKKRTAHLAYERMTRQEQLDRSGLIYGMLALGFGGVLAILCWLRSEYLQDDWIGWVGRWLGALVFAAGAFVAIWFYRSLRSAQVLKREIEKEMQE